MNRYDILLGKKFSSLELTQDIEIPTHVGWARVGFYQKEPEHTFKRGVLLNHHFGSAPARKRIGINGHEDLHEHLRLQQRLGLDDNHIIVDKGDWERAKRYFWLGESDRMVKGRGF